MTFMDALAGLPFVSVLESLLPDLLLAFTFFTALCYAVFGRHFGRGRPAAAMSVAVGLALAFGLVWWETERGYSVRDLGPVAVVFAVIILAGIIFQAVRQVGGSWAGVGIALGVSVLIGWLLGMPAPVDANVVSSVAFVVLLAGIVAFFLHRQGERAKLISMAAEAAAVRLDLRDLYEDRSFADRVTAQLLDVRRQAEALADRPEMAGDVMVQLQRILPEEGWLTERLAQLRAKARLIRAGHIARIDELRGVMARLPPPARRKLAEELASRCAELRIDARIERLDRAVAENERRIRDLTRQAQEWLATWNYRELSTVLDKATSLQRHNANLLRIIERTEATLLAEARRMSEESGGVSGG